MTPATLFPLPLDVLPKQWQSYMRMRSLREEYVALRDCVIYAHFSLSKGTDSWVRMGDGGCVYSFEFGMDVGIPWKKASKCCLKILSNETLKWRGVTERRAGMWWGDRTALEEAFSTFFSLLLFFPFGCWCHWMRTSCCVWFSQDLLFWRNVQFCEISYWLTFSHPRGSLLIPGDSIIPWTIPAMLLARPEHIWEMWTSVFAMPYPDMSLRCIVCRITKETTCEQGNPLPVFGKSSVTR